MSEPTTEELIDIANNFLLSSPPGEFMEVVTDVRALLPQESMINESAPRTFREYNTEQMVVVDSPGHSHKVLITKYGEVADGEYLDPRGNQVVTYDHIRQEVTGKRGISGDLDSSLEPLRSAFDKASTDYVAQHYPSGATTIYGKDGKIIICISSARFNPNSFWNGRWRSVWTYSDGQLSGHLKIVVHYYEDGNVQLNTDTTQSMSIPETGGPDAIASAAIKAITKKEQDFQAALDASYSTMGATTLKALRRALPITGQRIDWSSPSKVKGYRLGSDMSK